MVIELTDEELKAELARREKEREREEEEAASAAWKSLEEKFQASFEKVDKALDKVRAALREAEKVSGETGIPLRFNRGTYTPNTYNDFSDEEQEFLSENGYSGIRDKWHIDSWYHSASC